MRFKFSLNKLAIKDENVLFQQLNMPKKVKWSISGRGVDYMKGWGTRKRCSRDFSKYLMSCQKTTRKNTWS